MQTKPKDTKLFVYNELHEKKTKKTITVIKVNNIHFYIVNGE